MEGANRNWYDRYHKLMLIVPVVFLIFSVVYLYNFTSKTGDIISKDVSLTGGTTVSVFDGSVDITKLNDALKDKFPDLSLRTISDIRTGKQQGFSLTTKADAPSIKGALESYLGYKLNNDNSSIEFSGESLSTGFYNQLRNAVWAAFLLMGIVVFLIFSTSWRAKSLAGMITATSLYILLPDIFRVISALAILVFLILGLIHTRKTRKDTYLILAAFVLLAITYFFFPIDALVLPFTLILSILYIINSIPAFAVILCAFADITMTVVVADLIGMSLSGAGVIAFLMLIGYSVDTDILLTTRLIKKTEGSVNHRVFDSFKTGITMTLTSIAAVGASLVMIYGFSDSLTQIFTILLIGLGFDMLNTWVTNASLLKWYVERKNIK